MNVGGRIAVGFECPACGQRNTGARILQLRLPQIELECLVCSWDWAVEAAYPPPAEAAP